MRRYLLVLDMELLAMDEEHDLEPINYLVERQEQEPCEVVVLSLVETREAKLSPLELVLGAVTSRAVNEPAKFPTAPQPGITDVAGAAIARRQPRRRRSTAQASQSR